MDEYIFHKKEKTKWMNIFSAKEIKMDEYIFHKK
jgi:hypothetical protein